jgi:hypothetical protein
MTSFHSDQATWTIDNLPEILYVLQPGSEHAKSRAATPASPLFIFGKKTRSYRHLPRQISSKVEGWQLEAWMRTDRRITTEDILDRINPSFGTTMDELETRRAAFRDKFHLAHWDSHVYGVVVFKLKAAGIDPGLNSTRGLAPGLVDPAKGVAGGSIPVPPGFCRFLVPCNGRTLHSDD